MSTPIPDDTLEIVFYTRQKEKCAGCGKKLIWENRDKGDTGAWHAHHMDKNEDNNKSTNIACLCINPPNCHLEIGHSGDFESGELATTDDLPWFHGKISTSHQ